MSDKYLEITYRVPDYILSPETVLKVFKRSGKIQSASAFRTHIASANTFFKVSKLRLKIIGNNDLARVKHVRDQ